MSHEQAKKELQAGTPPELICATCPWDRLCVQPPSVSSQEIERQMAEAKAKDEIDMAADPTGKRLPIGSLMTAMVMGGRDASGALCPVFALRLRGPDGRQVADALRNTMRSWGES